MMLINEMNGSTASVTLEQVIEAGRFVGVCDIPAALYHSSPGLSCSHLKAAKKSMAHFEAYPRKTHEREVIGTGTHMRTLQMDLFLSLLERLPNRMGGNSTKAKEMESAGRFVMTEKEYTQVCRMSDAILEDPSGDCQKILSKGKAEQSVFWIDPTTQMLMKCRPDWLRDDGIIVDLKYFNTVSDERAWADQSYRMLYHWQSAFYLEGVNATFNLKSNAFAHIVVTDSDPFVARPWVLDDASLEKAAFDYRPLLAEIAECTKTGKWPAFKRPEMGITSYALPTWAWN